MDTQQKERLINAIISKLSFEAKRQNKQFDAGDTFFSLCFKSDIEINSIAKLAGI